MAKIFETDLRNGLSEREIDARLEKYGENELEKEEDKSIWEKIKEQFEDTLVRILLVAALVSFALALSDSGHEGLAAYVEPFVILLILFINAAVGIWQENNADNALEELKKMQAVTCQVIRDG